MRASRRHFVGLATSLAVVLTMGMGVPGVARGETELKAKIPFEFYVGDKKFAPGDYKVLVCPTYIRLSDRKGNTSFVLTTGVTKSNWNSMHSGLLVFTTYDNYRFLSQVWREGYSAGNELIKAPLEIQVARNHS